jgi:hypothetical protein
VLLLLVRLASEVALLAALAVTGTAVGGGPGTRLLLMGLLPGVAIAVWWRFVAPKASRRLPDPDRLVVEVVLFAVSAFGVWLAGHALVAAVYGVVSVVTAVLVRRFAPGA